MHASKLELMKTLRRVPLFTDLSEREITLIAENVSSLRYEQGATIFSEGDPCHELLIVEEGTVKIVKSAGSQSGTGLRCSRWKGGTALRTESRASTRLKDGESLGEVAGN